MKEFVLDSWILVGWLRQQQPAHDKMRELWERGIAHEVSLSINLVNFGEVLFTMARYEGLDKARQIVSALRQTELRQIPATNDTAWEAAELKARYPISYPDAFAAVTAIRRKAPLVTGDREFRRLEADGVLKLHWVGDE